MAEIGGLLFCGSSFLIGTLALLLAIYFFLKSRKGEQELERKMKEGPTDNV